MAKLEILLMVVLILPRLGYLLVCTEPQLAYASARLKPRVTVTGHMHVLLSRRFSAHVISTSVPVFMRRSLLHVPASNGEDSLLLC